MAFRDPKTLTHPLEARRKKIRRESEIVAQPVETRESSGVIKVLIRPAFMLEGPFTPQSRQVDFDLLRLSSPRDLREDNQDQ